MQSCTRPTVGHHHGLRGQEKLAESVAKMDDRFAKLEERAATKEQADVLTPVRFTPSSPTLGCPRS